MPDADQHLGLEATPLDASDIEALLADSDSDSDDDVLEMQASSKHSENNGNQMSLLMPIEKKGESTDSDSASFMNEDPLESDDNEPWDSPSTTTKNTPHQPCFPEDTPEDPDSDEDYFNVKPGENSKESIDWNPDSSSEDDFDEKAEEAPLSPLTPRIVVGSFDDSFTCHADNSTSRVEDGPNKSEEVVPQSSSSTIVAGKIRVKDDFLGDSDSDGAFS